mmetsp:Transcript_41573/g.88150  ORF Transcript_41573/g.88150 Transcript_41573/m.88150 type:complete len:222 (+) Transcript_41573:94-759(+)
MAYRVRTFTTSVSAISLAIVSCFSSPRTEVTCSIKSRPNFSAFRSVATTRNWQFLRPSCSSATCTDQSSGVRRLEVTRSSSAANCWSPRATAAWRVDSAASMRLADSAARWWSLFIACSAACRSPLRSVARSSWRHLSSTALHWLLASLALSSIRVSKWLYKRVISRSINCVSRSMARLICCSKLPRDSAISVATLRTESSTWLRRLDSSPSKAFTAASRR